MWVFEPLLISPSLSRSAYLSLLISLCLSLSPSLSLSLSLSLTDFLPPRYIHQMPPLRRAAALPPLHQFVPAAERQWQQLKEAVTASRQAFQALVDYFGEEPPEVNGKKADEVQVKDLFEKLDAFLLDFRVTNAQIKDEKHRRAIAEANAKRLAAAQHRASAAPAPPAPAAAPHPPPPSSQAAGGASDAADAGIRSPVPAVSPASRRNRAGKAQSSPLRRASSSSFNRAGPVKSVHRVASEELGLVAASTASASAAAAAARSPQASPTRVTPAGMRIYGSHTPMLPGPSTPMLPSPDSKSFWSGPAAPMMATPSIPAPLPPPEPPSAASSPSASAAADTADAAAALPGAGPGPTPVGAPTQPTFRDAVEATPRRGAGAVKPRPILGGGGGGGGPSAMAALHAALQGGGVRAGLKKVKAPKPAAPLADAPPKDDPQVRAYAKLFDDHGGDLAAVSAAMGGVEFRQDVHVTTGTEFAAKLMDGSLTV